eukprot:TRINITY_DN4153_c0_g2_i1.p1 TRINITY_DN4153_c0_g2~~TRINITY_DN4153_c0_g2_i1.p1  ORF type:complete len:673 (+),score=91.94 TRINITY_DN4153_c0_g2_i1:265-2019(+)
MDSEQYQERLSATMQSLKKLEVYKPHRWPMHHMRHQSAHLLSSVRSSLDDAWGAVFSPNRKVPQGDANTTSFETLPASKSALRDADNGTEVTATKSTTSTQIVQVVVKTPVQCDSSRPRALDVSASSPGELTAGEMLDVSQMPSGKTSSLGGALTMRLDHEVGDITKNAMGLVGRVDTGSRIFKSKSQERVFSVVHSTSFEMFTLVVIFASALQIGLSTDYMVSNQRIRTPPGHRAAEIVFCVFFTLELLLRIFVHRCEFFSMWGWAWNWFDLLLVISTLAEEIVLAAMEQRAELAKDLKGLSSSFLLRTLRLLRAVRVLRVLRVALAAEDLRLLVSCLVFSLRSFFWILVLLMMMLYIIGIYLTQLVYFFQRDTDDWNDMKEHYGSVPSSMLSLFQGLTGGLDWDTLVRPLITHISPWLGVAFVGYTAFAILGVMNVVTGTFVQNCITRAENVKNLQRAIQARKLFKFLDDDGSGVISFREIESHLQDHAVLDFFQRIDVEPSEAKFLFEMLDINNSGSIDFEEFMNGCIRLQGHAKALDLLQVNREMRTAFEKISSMLVRHEGLLQVLSQELLVAGPEKQLI